MPKRTDEAWRFAHTSRLALEGYHSPSQDLKGLAEALPERSDWLSDYAGRIILADNQTVGAPASSKAPEYAPALWAPLASVLSQPDALANSSFQERYLASQPLPLGSQKFSTLHTALNDNGVVLHIPRGVVVEEPFIVYHWACEPDQALFPQTLVIAEEGSQAQVIEVFLSADPEAKAFVCAAATIYAGPGAKVHYQAIQSWNSVTRGMLLNRVHAERDADVRTVNINLGAEYLRHEHQSELLGSGSNVETYSLSMPIDNQEFDQRTLQTHKAPNSRSDILFKNVLFDEGRTIFSGLIRVEEGAQKVDAYQTNRNLLLSKAAESNSLPGLEIKANDVKCSHGATSGYLDEKDIFYFLARGIPRSEAQELMAFGFFDEILTKLDGDSIIDKVSGLISDKLKRQRSLQN